MTAFFVRVEMHGATLEDYAALNLMLEREGFKPALRGVAGNSPDVLRADYDVDVEDDQWTASVLRLHVLNVTDQIRDGAWVLALRSDDPALGWVAKS